MTQQAAVNICHDCRQVKPIEEFEVRTYDQKRKEMRPPQADYSKWCQACQRRRAWKSDDT